MKFGDWVSGTDTDGYFISGIVCGHMKGNRTKILVCNFPNTNEFAEADILEVKHSGHEKEARKLRRNFFKEYPNMLAELK